MLLLSVLIISICALTYELIVATLSSYLLGDSITQFSITIGLFLSAMGLGALLSRRIRHSELYGFIIVELLTGLFGGFAAAILYAIFTSADEYYFPVMVAIIMSVGICIGLEIPLLTRIVANRADLSKALADVLSIDYLGALIGSVAFPILLLPALGVTLTGFVMGLLNITVAALILQQFKHRLSPRRVRRLWIGVIGLGIVMLAGALLASDFVALFEQQIYQERIIYREQTPYQRIIMTRGGDDDLRLFLDGNLQFSSRDEYRYHEMLVHPVMSAARSHENIVVLGGGDGLVARELLKYPDVQHITIVDLDPAMTQLARNFAPIRELNGSALDDPRVTVVNTDAYKFIEQSGDMYSVIIIDLPDPNNESLSKLYSQQFYRLLHQRLSPDGAFVTQAASPYFVHEAYWIIANTIEASGFRILPLRTYVPSFGEWGFVIGTTRVPPQVSPPDASIPVRYLNEQALAVAQAFDPDVARMETGINTLDNPVLPRAYELGWASWD